MTQDVVKRMHNTWEAFKNRGFGFPLFRDLQSGLKVLQRKASRKKKRSKNWEKAQLKVARYHHKIANSRKNFHFQTSHQLCNQADMIFVEDIDFRVSAKGIYRKHMLDGGFGQFRQLLSWVCWKRGKYFSTVDHKYTSQICPECNTHTGKKELDQREHICPECGYSTIGHKLSLESSCQ